MSETRNTLSLKAPLKTIPASLKALKAAAHAEFLRESKANKIIRKRESAKRMRDIVLKLCERFPACFLLAAPKPLKKGIHEDIYEAAGESFISKSELLPALKYYANSLAYHRSVLQNAHRYDLEGHIAGEVSEEDKHYASQAVERLEQKWMESQENQPRFKKPFSPYKKGKNHFLNRDEKKAGGCLDQRNSYHTELSAETL